MLKKGVQLITLAIWMALVSACTPILTSQPIADNKGTRSLGTLYNDQLIESSAADAISRSSILFASANVSVISVNGIVLLIGQVPNEDTKIIAGGITQNISNVRKVHNELLVSGPASGVVKANDALITTKVKARMLAETDFPTSRIKVVTENGVVYLMGLVTQAEANWAVGIASNASGIQRIVKVFEYID